MKFSKRSILLNTVLFVIIGSSIVLNFLLFNQAKKYYFELNQTRLDPSGLNYYPINLKQANNTNQIRVVFFGDSRAENWTAPNLSGYEFMNRGISSQTSVQAIQRFSSHVSSLKPNVVIIQVGINDLKTVALFPEQRDAIVATCRANIKRMVEESRKLGAVVIITTIFPPGDVPLERKPFWSDEIGRSVKEMNAYIATLADDKIFIFDAFSLLVDSRGLMAQEYSSDELHLNEKGYRILNPELVKLINQIKSETAKN
jgi:lysophospholipase L1-like esterase